MERMCYSYSALLECVDLVKRTEWACGSIKEHRSKLFEVKKVFEFCMSKTNCLIFDPLWAPWNEYDKAIKFGCSKKELDKCLNACYRYICNELNSISKMIGTGEVDCTE